jgi:putative phage-type endonuclease
MQTLEFNSRAEWLARRRQGVGASEAAVIFGKSPWKTPLQLYLEKTGEFPEQEQTDAMRRGLRLERFVAEEYQEETGITLEKPPAIIIHPEAPWCLASLDYWIPGQKVVQIKTSDTWAAAAFGEPGTDEVPEHYALQVQQEMAVSGLPVAEIALLHVGTWRFDVYVIERNPGVIEAMIEAEREFMDRVCRRDPPLPDFTHPTTAEILAMLEPTAGEAIFLDDEAQELADEYTRLGAAAGETKKRRDELKARLIYAMGPAEKGELPDGRIVRRKAVERKGYTVAPSNYVDFRILKAKG